MKIRRYSEAATIKESILAREHLLIAIKEFFRPLSYFDGCCVLWDVSNNLKQLNVWVGGYSETPSSTRFLFTFEIVDFYLVRIKTDEEGNILLNF